VFSGRPVETMEPVRRTWERQAVTSVKHQECFSNQCERDTAVKQTPNTNRSDTRARARGERAELNYLGPGRHCIPLLTGGHLHLEVLHWIPRGPISHVWSISLHGNVKSEWAASCSRS